MDDAERGANATLTIDLPAQEIRGPDGGVVRFEVDPFRKQCLIEGLDDIGLTMVEALAIAAHEREVGGGASVALSLCRAPRAPPRDWPAAIVNARRDPVISPKRRRGERLAR